ncbi:hypothetical protein HK096_005589 [Nowakowskiella sp. JEL0078]|nr:hypothetical protein HK096_005589 [Nowakowskiella sp. JEL0078]
MLFPANHMHGLLRLPAEPLLPPELWLSVYSFLPPRMCFYVIPSVCSLWRSIILHPSSNRLNTAAISFDLSFRPKPSQSDALKRGCFKISGSDSLLVNLYLLPKFRDLGVCAAFPTDAKSGLSVSISSSIDAIWVALCDEITFSRPLDLSIDAAVFKLKFTRKLADYIYEMTGRFFKPLISHINFTSPCRESQSAKSLSQLYQLLEILSPTNMILQPSVISQPFLNLLPVSLVNLRMERCLPTTSFEEIGFLTSLCFLHISADISTNLPNASVQFRFESFLPLSELPRLQSLHFHESVNMDDPDSFCRLIVTNITTLKSFTAYFLSDGFKCRSETLALLFSHPNLTSLTKISHASINVWNMIPVHVKVIEIEPTTEIPVLIIPSPRVTNVANSAHSRYYSIGPESPPYSILSGSPLRSPMFSPYSPSYQDQGASDYDEFGGWSPPYSTTVPESTRKHSIVRTSHPLRILHLEFADLTIEDLRALERIFKTSFWKLTDLTLEIHVSGLAIRRDRNQTNRRKFDNGKRRKFTINTLAIGTTSQCSNESEVYADVLDIAEMIANLFFDRNAEDDKENEFPESKCHPSIRKLRIIFIGENECDFPNHKNCHCLEKSPSVVNRCWRDLNALVNRESLFDNTCAFQRTISISWTGRFARFEDQLDL